MTILEKSIIRFHNVKFGYGISSSILNNVNIDIKQGGFYFLTGKSGAGKTSLTEMLCRNLSSNYSMAVITNDIYTAEDAEYLMRKQVLPL